MPDGILSENMTLSVALFQIIWKNETIFRKKKKVAGNTVAHKP